VARLRRRRGDARAKPRAKHSLARAGEHVQLAPIGRLPCAGWPLQGEQGERNREGEGGGERERERDGVSGRRNSNDVRNVQEQGRGVYTMGSTGAAHSQTSPCVRRYVQEQGAAAGAERL
jgi:hypothetical protein